VDVLLAHEFGTPMAVLQRCQTDRPALLCEALPHGVGAAAGHGGMSGAVVTSSLLPDTPKRREDEYLLQKAVCQLLKFALPPDAEYFSIPNGGLRHTKVAMKLAATGCKAGVPDLCVCWKGRAIFIELKADRGRLSASQRQMIDKLPYRGCEVLCCRTVDCVYTGLMELGIPLSDKVRLT